MKLKLSLLLFTLIMGSSLSGLLNAQISVKGDPYSNKAQKLNEMQSVKMSSFDVDKMKREDLFESQYKDIPPRFGKDFDVNIGYTNSGTFDVLPDGSKIWRLSIKSPGAISINLIFDKFYLPKNTTMFVYNVDKSHVLGAFTDLNNNDNRLFSTAPVKGDEIIIEYNSPAYVSELPQINLSKVIHGYQNIFNLLKQKDYAGSGPCNRNIICPEGDPYKDQIRATILLLNASNTRLCSGSMVNNTRFDGTPYMLTANHCYDASYATWIIVFKYEAPTCPNPGGDGPLTYTISGTSLCAKNSPSDFCLVKLSSKPPVSYNTYYAGWNHSNVPPTSGICVHHPDCDVKKISFITTPFTPTSYNSPPVPGDSSHWHVQWASIPSTGLTPVTEPGSSGSPLFNQWNQVVGQLHGGPSSCTATDKSDYYGKFDRSWTGGGTSATRLRDWLDSANTGVMFIGGYDPNSGPLNTYNLQTPNAGVTVTTIPGSTTPYTFNWDTASAAATYKWIFGQSLPTRQLTVTSPTRPLNMTLGQLDALIASLGVAPGGSISGSWDVWAFRNNLPNNDSLKASNGPRTITFTRYQPVLTAFNLVSPATNFSVTSMGGSTTPVNFVWNKTGLGGATYKFLYKTGASYSDPATLRLPANSSGFDTVLTITLGQLDSYLAGLGVALGDSISGYWRVRAYTSTDSLSSTTPDRKVTFRRALFSSTVWTGNLTGAPTFDRPVANSTNSNIPPTSLYGSQRQYSFKRITVSNTGMYYIYTGADYDNYILLYQNSFTPGSPLTNVLGGNDDTTATFMPEYTSSLARSAINSYTLQAGTTYIVVNSIYGTSMNTGAFKDSVWGPGVITVLTAISENGNFIPTKYSLKQNYPNPFNPVTKINFDIPKQGFVTLKIYDMLGREIKTLVNGIKQSGYYSVDFDASEFASGVYFYKLQTDEFSDIKKMILIK
jgi:hypothetical protein